MVMLSGPSTLWLLGGGLAISSGFDLCLRSLAAASAAPPGGWWGALGDPNHPRTASVALMCRWQKAVPLSLVVPFPLAGTTTPKSSKNS